MRVRLPHKWQVFLGALDPASLSDPAPQSVFANPQFHQPGATQVLEAWDSGYVASMDTPGPFETKENDFKVASQILRRRKDIVPDAACFFCQQCVEKYLKARLVEAGISFHRTHDLLVLLNLCLPVEPLWSPYAKTVDELSDYAVDFRYPGHFSTLAEARKALKNCKAVRQEVRASLGLPVR